MEEIYVLILGVKVIDIIYSYQISGLPKVWGLEGQPSEATQSGRMAR